MEFKDFSLSIQDAKVGEFAEGLAQGKILHTECRNCGGLYYPPRHDCPRCMKSNMEWKKIEGTGELVSFTLIHIPPEHFALNFGNQAPFSSYEYRPTPIGIVRLEGGLQVMGWIPDPEDLQVGLRLRPEPRVLPDGRVTIVLTKVGAQR
jgi:uncharacterized OB-fold protein